MVECEICGFLRIDPIPDQDIINSLYTENSVSEQRLEYEVFSSPFLTTLKKNIIIKPLLYKLKNRLKDIKNPTLLDIGCATGWITSNSKDAGFDVLGLEANPVIAKYGRDKYGIEIFEGFIEDLDINMKFNAITMFHILEHLTDPLQILKKVSSHLTDNGKLLIVIPNADSLGVGIFGQFYNWNIPDHISFFSPATISELMEISGFRVLGISHLTSPPMLIYSFNKCMDHRKKNGDYG
ncbi:MAG: class I SAM-dependent methyltransferase, partial [Thermodesulfobacteriota bacterium]